MKSPISVIITDTHLSPTNIEVNKSIFRQAAQLCLDLGLKEIDHAGDIFHSRKGQLQVVLVAYKEILDELHEKGIKLNQVVGNHDKTEYSISESFIDPYEHHPALNLIRRFDHRVINGEILISYLSYYSDEQYKSELDTLSKEIKGLCGINVLLTHIGISGAMMNSGIVVESGVTPSLFESFDLTLVGHYHDAQSLADGRIKYIGASLQHNFGEQLGKGATVLYDDLSIETVQFKYPQFIKYEVAPGQLTKSDIDDLKKEKDESGDNIRIVLVGTEADLKSFNKQILIDAGVSVQHKPDEINVEELEQRIGRFDLKSLHNEFNEFCKKNGLDVESGMKYFNHIINSPTI